MKKYILIALILCLSLVSADAFAQSGNSDLESYRVAFLTKELSLTPEEAQKFWPVYNQYRSEITSLRRQYKPADGGSTDARIEYKEKELEVLKKYNPQFKQALPPAKLSKLNAAEEKFMKEVLRKVKG
ncbi:MAG: hypothetical protein ACJAZ3_000354 [Sphingobacteriales bacterium]|jgi:hypothetical protein